MLVGVAAMWCCSFLTRKKTKASYCTDEAAELNRGLEARVAEQVDELGRVGRLKRFLAPQLAELIVLASMAADQP